MSYLIALSVVITVVALIAGRKTVMRTLAALGGQLNKTGLSLWRADPVAIYQKQVDDATEEMQSGRKGLEQYRGHVAQLQRKVDTGKKEIEVLQARAEGFARQGNDQKAIDVLAEKRLLEVTLASDQRALGNYETAYQNNLQKIQYAQRKIEEAKREAHRLQADLRLSKAEAEIARLNINFDGSSLSGLGEARDEIQRQIDANRAVAQVATDLGDNSITDRQAEETQRRAEAANDLAALKAKIDVRAN